MATAPDDSAAFIVRVGNAAVAPAARGPGASQPAANDAPGAVEPTGPPADDFPTPVAPAETLAAPVVTTLAAPTMPEVAPMSDITTPGAPAAEAAAAQETPTRAPLDDAALAREADEADAEIAADAPAGTATATESTATIAAASLADAGAGAAATADADGNTDEPALSAAGAASAAPLDEADEAEAAAAAVAATAPRKTKRGKGAEAGPQGGKTRRYRRVGDPLRARCLFPRAGARVARGASARRVLAQLAGVRADEDPEAVHDMRVALRRLRAALAVAEPFFGRKPFRRASRRVRALARALGQVRDADVLLGHLRERYMVVAEDERIGIEGLIDMIAADRAGARDDLDPVLDEWDEDGAHVAGVPAVLGASKIAIGESPGARSDRRGRRAGDR